MNSDKILVVLFLFLSAVSVFQLHPMITVSEQNNFDCLPDELVEAVALQSISYADCDIIDKRCTVTFYKQIRNAVLGFPYVFRFLAQTDNRFCKIFNSGAFTKKVLHAIYRKIIDNNPINPWILHSHICRDAYVARKTFWGLEEVPLKGFGALRKHNEDYVDDWRKQSDSFDIDTFLLNSSRYMPEYEYYGIPKSHIGASLYCGTSNTTEKLIGAGYPVPAYKEVIILLQFASRYNYFVEYTNLDLVCKKWGTISEDGWRECISEWKLNQGLISITKTCIQRYVPHFVEYTEPATAQKVIKSLFADTSLPVNMIIAKAMQQALSN